MGKFQVDLSANMISQLPETVTKLRKLKVNQSHLHYSCCHMAFTEILAVCLVVSDAGAEQHWVNESTICVIQDVFAAVNIRTPQHRDNS